jgi:urease beta subunit
MIPGEIIIKNKRIQLNKNAEVKTISVTNNGNRPVQVGSHIHFFEINRCMNFDRTAALGYRLDIPSGTAIRFAPGETKAVNLILIGGNQRLFGINNLTDAQLNQTSFDKALLQAKLKRFM